MKILESSTQKFENISINCSVFTSYRVVFWYPSNALQGLRVSGDIFHGSVYWKTFFFPPIFPDRKTHFKT